MNLEQKLFNKAIDIVNLEYKSIDFSYSIHEPELLKLEHERAKTLIEDRLLPLIKIMNNTIKETYTLVKKARIYENIVIPTILATIHEVDPEYMEGQVEYIKTLSKSLSNKFDNMNHAEALQEIFKEYFNIIPNEKKSEAIETTETEKEENKEDIEKEEDKEKEKKKEEEDKEEEEYTSMDILNETPNV